MHGAETPPAERALPDGFAEILLSLEPPFDVNWQLDPLELDEPTRLDRLARVKATLPAENEDLEGITHDQTIENYLRLALVSAGDRETLETFLELVETVLTTQPERSADLAQQVFWIWAPAAEVAGFYNQKIELEELAFKILMPEEYQAIREDYDKSLLMGDEGIIARLETDIDHLLSEALPEGVAFEIASRAKSYYSVWRKLQKEGRDTAELLDLVGIRVIIDADEEIVAAQQCYVAMAAVASQFEVQFNRIKDYIKVPKPNGYQSLHLTLHNPYGLPFELQVRSRSMHIRAETDTLASHQGYDAAFKKVPGKVHRTFRTVPKLYRWRDEATRSIIKNNQHTTAILDKWLLFFRDDGNLYRLPAKDEPTMLDASFKVHSRRALKTRRIARRDGKLIGLEHPVSHGDVLSFEYHSDYPKQPDRFNVLKRKAHLTDTVRYIDNQRRQILAPQLLAVAISLIDQESGIEGGLSVLTVDDRRELAQRAGVPTFEKLLVLVGDNVPDGKRTRIVARILERCGVGGEPRIATTGELAPEASYDAKIVSMVEVAGVDDTTIECRVAGCCSEQITPGEAVVARVSTHDKAIKVHRRECNNIRSDQGLLECSWRDVTFE